MKKIISVIFSTIFVAILLTACSQPGESPASSGQASIAETDPTQSAFEPDEIKPTEPNEAPAGGSNILIVYYSLTGTTEGIATLLQEKNRR